MTPSLAGLRMDIRELVLRYKASRGA